LKRFGRISSLTRVRLFASWLVLLSLSVFATAQTQTARYIYDDDGRLRAVIAPNGEAAVYDYDAAGNFTAIRRLAADALELLTFAPRSGPPGTQVIFHGIGFGAGVSTITFGGGVAGQLVGFTNNTITAIVPDGAVTGVVTINTARGTVTTAVPFVVQGVIVNPKEATAIDGESVQFNATVIVPGDDQSVSWSVNGVEGGSDTLGIITEAGLYTAPPDPSATFSVTVRAVSVAFPALEGTATVHVRSLSDFRFTISPGVSIGKGETFTTPFVFGPGVSVGKGEAFSTPFVFGPGVSVGKAQAFLTPFVSSGVSIGKGEPFAVASLFSPGISVGKVEGFNYGAFLSRGVSLGKAANFSTGGAFSSGVMLTNGPLISAVSPGSIARGSTITVTLNGLNFSGANNVRLFNPDGSETTDITASNINVNGNGTSLTVNLSIHDFAVIGRRIIVVTTPTAHSLRIDLNVNTIQITPP